MREDSGNHHVAPAVRKGSFYRTQMSQHADFEKILPGWKDPRRRSHRLKDDAGPALQMRRQLGNSFGLQHDKARGQFESLARPGMAVDVPVEIRTCQGQYQRPIRIAAPITHHRTAAAASVQGDQQVA